MNAYRILVGKPEVKRPLGRPKRSFEDNIRMELREIGWDGMDLIGLAQDRDKRRALANTVLNICFHKMLGTSSVTLKPVASQLRLSSSADPRSFCHPKN
jgi:hypothetical protein